MRKAYPREFRDDVVAVARRCEAGLSTKQIADEFGISGGCRVHSTRQETRAAGVARGAFAYRTILRPPTDRAIRRLLVSGAVAAVHVRSRAVYGYRRAQVVLRMESDLVVNHKLVASTMAELGLRGLPRRRAPRRDMASITTISDLVNRNFAANSTGINCG